VTAVVRNLFESKCSVDEPFVDSGTGRWETPLHMAATFASEHQKGSGSWCASSWSDCCSAGAMVTVVNLLLEYEAGTFSLADTGKYADPMKRAQEAKVALLCLCPRPLVSCLPVLSIAGAGSRREGQASGRARFVA